MLLFSRYFMPSPIFRASGDISCPSSPGRSHSSSSSLHPPTQFQTLCMHAEKEGNIQETAAAAAAVLLLLLLQLQHQEDKLAPQRSWIKWQQKVVHICSLFFFLWLPLSYSQFPFLLYLSLLLGIITSHPLTSQSISSKTSLTHTHHSSNFASLCRNSRDLL